MSDGLGTLCALVVVLWFLWEWAWGCYVDWDVNRKARASADKEIAFFRMGIEKAEAEGRTGIADFLRKRLEEKESFLKSLDGKG